MDYQEQQLLRNALEENFRTRTQAELEGMFQRLIKSGGTEAYIKTVNDKVWRVGVVLGPNNFLYYSTEHESDTAWLYED